MDYGLLQALMKRLDSSAARLAVIFISFFLKDQVKCTASTAVVAYAPVHMDWNFTEPEPLKCYSCQSEDSDDVCMHMNNTDLVPTLLCPAHQSWCKVRCSPTSSQKRLKHLNSHPEIYTSFLKGKRFCSAIVGFRSLRGFARKLQ
ncbi:hypothetical protein RvY_02673-2 [Ramazzottius varieornatus]|uniref:Uncharacterized protein n=1 Tax=Ramazzottius varieornatus TaxID=947166 RepID=A0A1D1UKK0_RAMVA|nr:hypothetical protein RvY_02673-2 [Ramazzottius varieornatus]